MLLSILIPTYNRCVYLKRNLEILLPQLEGKEKEVEIIISDNCSTDNTREVIEELKNNYSKLIKYYRQRSNIGADNNLKWVFNLSSAEYVYFLGDDDVLNPQFIQIIIPILKNCYKYSIIHWNRLSGDGECKNNIIVDPNYGESEWEGSPSEFITKFLDKTNFISCSIINKRCWNLGESFIKEKEKEYSGYEWYARVLWGILEYNGICKYFYFPLIIQRNPPKSWIQYWPQYFICSMSNIFYDLDSVVPGIYKKWEVRLRENIANVLPIIASYRSYYRQSSIKKMMVRHLTGYEKICFFFYLNVPGSYILYSLKHKLRRVAEILLG